MWLVGMFPESRGFVAMPVTRYIIYTCSIYPYLISEGSRIVRPCDRPHNKTVTLGKPVTKYKHIRQFMVEFLRKFMNRGIKNCSN